MKISLLDLLDDTQIRSTAQLAERLGTTVEMTEARLERYEQLGVVKKTVMHGSDCGNCQKCKGCNHQSCDIPVVFWEKI